MICPSPVYRHFEMYAAPEAPLAYAPTNEPGVGKVEVSKHSLSFKGPTMTLVSYRSSYL